MSKSARKPDPENGDELKVRVIEQAEARINELLEAGMMHTPPNYSTSNALRAAWLILQETVDKDKRPVLDVCTRNSIANALLRMVVQGLDPSKAQCYFIAHGNRLQLRRSYFGTLALAKRFAKVRDAWAQPVYKGDEFEYEIQFGRKHVTRHHQTLESVDEGTIVAAYAVAEFEDDRLDTEIMTRKEIDAAWAKGGDKNPARKEFPGEMSKRTVLNRLLKRHVNSSDDEALGLALHYFNATDAEEAAEEVEVEASEHANTRVLTIEEPASTRDEEEQWEEPEEADSDEVREPEPPEAEEAPPAPF